MNTEKFRRSQKFLIRSIIIFMIIIISVFMWVIILTILKISSGEHLNNLNTVIVYTIIFILSFLIAILKFLIDIGKKAPSEQALFIAHDSTTLPPSSSLYWMNNKGIWENNKLLFNWNEVKDVYILRTWTMKKPGFPKSSIFALLSLLIGPDPYVMTWGLLRIILKDGRIFDIDNVRDPKRLVYFIKRVYLNRS